MALALARNAEADTIVALVREVDEGGGINLTTKTRDGQSSIPKDDVPDLRRFDTFSKSLEASSAC